MLVVVLLQMLVVMMLVLAVVMPRRQWFPGAPSQRRRGRGRRQGAIRSIDPGQ